MVSWPRYYFYVRLKPRKRGISYYLRVGKERGQIVFAILVHKLYFKLYEIYCYRYVLYNLTTRKQTSDIYS